MTSNFNISKQDPDYDEVIATPESFRRQDEEKSKRENSIRKIRDIIERQFNGEIQAKEEEVLGIEKKISQTKSMLDQLRAYLLANYYGCNGRLIRGYLIEKKKRERKQNEVKLRKEGSNENLNEIEGSSKSENILSDDGIGNVESKLSLGNAKCTSLNSFDEVKNCLINQPGDSCNVTSANRFYVKKNVIIGNISKFIPLERREKSDQATHRWMVYVRGPPGEPDLSSFIQCVWFILHPSYMPNDIIEVTRPPFTVTRRGWGEFPVRIQLVFNDPRNKPVDIIHNLKLDKTYTGLQTLGAETKIAIELQRHTMDEKYEKEAIETSSEKINSNENISSFGRCNDAQSVALDSLSESVIEKENENGLAFKKHSETLSEMVSGQKVVGPQRGGFGEIFQDRSLSGPTLTTKDTYMSLSCPSSRICSPIPPAPKKKVVHLDSFMEEALSKNVSRFPLICADRDIAKLHYCAKTMQQFSSWSFSKRRASEWQRALDLKRYLTKTGISDDITTKGVMMWCRKHGYAPAENEGLVVLMDDMDHCPKCGKCFPNGKSHGDEAREARTSNKWCSSCLSDLTVKNTSTLTSFEELTSELASQDNYLCNLTERNEVWDDSVDTYLDVVGIESTEKKEDVDEMLDTDKIDLIEASLLTDWIFEAAAQIEVDLKSIIRNGRSFPILQQLLLEAMKCFVRDILTRSYANAKNYQSNLEPVVITPMHVLHALRLSDTMDFLTNKFFGIEEEDGNL